MSPLRILRGFVFGAIGGAIGWLLTEFLPLGFPFQLHVFEARRYYPDTNPATQGLFGIVLGLAISAFLGLSEGIAEGTVSRFRRVMLWFVGLGALGGFLGLFFGQWIYGALGGRTTEGLSPQQLIVRSIGWMLIGLFLGVIYGVPNLSTRRMINGAFGGAIGGILGGFFLETLPRAGLGIMQPMHARFIGFALMGGAIGFFINLIAEATKRVWVKVLVGRNEGREFVIDTPIAVIGRDELVDVPVFLDPVVPKRMASLRLQEGRYALYAEEARPSIMVNGEPLQPGRLMRDGDAIQFGRVTLAYNEKASATGLQRPVDSISLSSAGTGSTRPGAVGIPAASNVCSFCGQMKDAAGNCACSVPADAGMVQQPVYATAGMDPAYAATVMDPGVMPAYTGAAAVEGPRVVAVGGPHAGQVFPLDSEVMTMGREPSMMIPLTSDTTASRRHASVQYVNGAWSVRDEGSSNGTFVNGVRIQEQPLFPGDIIRVGSTELRFEF